MKKSQTITVLIIALLFVFEYVPTCFAVDDIEAANALNETEITLNSTFIAVVKAHNSGVDITSFLNKLDIAGSLLSKAHLAFRAEDYTGSRLLAEESSSTVKGLIIDVVLLQGEAEKTKNNFLLFTVLGSGVGLVLLLIFSIFGWTIIKKRYSKKILELKPEMEEVQ